MDIDSAQIKERRKIGTLHGAPVALLVTKGGLNMIVTKEGVGTKFIGTGPLLEIAKFTAEQREPDVLWELSKSNTSVDMKIFEPIIPDYIALTDRLNKGE